MNTTAILTFISGFIFGFTFAGTLLYIFLKWFNNPDTGG